MRGEKARAAREVARYRDSCRLALGRAVAARLAFDVVPAANSIERANQSHEVERSTRTYAALTVEGGADADGAIEQVRADIDEVMAAVKRVAVRSSKRVGK